jgi:putative transposase
VTARHDVIQAENAWFPVSRACDLLSVSRAGFYRSQTPAVSPRTTRHQALTTDIERVFRALDNIFGHRVVQQKLTHEGVAVSVGTVASIMSANAWKARRIRAFKRTTCQDAEAKFFPDLVRRDFTAEVPGTVLYGGITYLRTGEGWLYLATVINMCTRILVGWALGDNMKAPLVRKALHMNKGRGYVAKTAIFHSDRGSQYTSKEFARWCRDNGVT